MPGRFSEAQSRVSVFVLWGILVALSLWTIADALLALIADNWGAVVPLGLGALLIFCAYKLTDGFSIR